ncbi:MAG TPA: class I SAM-dependent methyltransferase [Myxococcota bacterium]|nr:class I SAM-dependent methyltransferase [Myxococcota bacterium]
MDALRFRAPGGALPLVALLARAAPFGDVHALAHELRAGGLRVRGSGGRALRDPTLRVEPGTEIEWRNPPPTAGDGNPASPRASGSAVLRYLALAPAPPWTSGALADPDARDGATLRFRRGEVRGGVAELELELSAGGAETVRRGLAAAGFPLLGDARFGGVLVEGGLRLRPALSSESVLGRAPEGWWPGEPVFAPELSSAGSAGEGACLEVSQASLRALSRGHPWILTDSETGDAGRFRPGALVWIRAAEGGTRGTRRTLARIEGKGSIAARVWARDIAKLREAPSVEARVAHALRRRAPLLSPPASAERTDAFRLIHGEADGLPGLAIDRLGPLLRVVASGRSCEGFEDRALDAVIDAMSSELGSDPPVVRVAHLRERPSGALRAVELIRGKLPPLGPDPGMKRLRVCERGLSFWIDPGLAQPEQSSPGVGLFLDQRENRARLAVLARAGGRWLNLFAHTGGFSAALLAAGAQEVLSVDLSAAYLRWLEENLALNGLSSPRHRAVRGDGRRVLKRLPEAECFEGIVIDPPTAAAAGRRFWSVRRDLAPLVGSALRRLVPGGTLLVCRNDRATRGALARLVQEEATRASVELARLESAPPGLDFPSLPGFPEGDSFEGVLAQRSSGGRARSEGSAGHAGGRARRSAGRALRSRPSGGFCDTLAGL